MAGSPSKSPLRARTGSLVVLQYVGDTVSSVNDATVPVTGATMLTGLICWMGGPLLRPDPAKGRDSYLVLATASAKTF